MGGALLHRDDRIEQYLEIRRSIARRVGSQRRCQMTACRESHDAHVLLVDMPLVSMSAHHLHRLLRILQGHLVVAMGHTVFQHDERNALPVEERSPVVTFMLHRQMLVAAARTAHHRPSRSLLAVGQVHPYLSLVFRVAIAHTCTVWPQIHLYRLLCVSRYCH